MNVPSAPAAILQHPSKFHTFPFFLTSILFFLTSCICSHLVMKLRARLALSSASSSASERIFDFFFGMTDDKKNNVSIQRTATMGLAVELMG